MASSQNWPKFVAATDFTTAFARLLRDGSLRDAFTADPSHLAKQFGVSDADLRALASLPSVDLEFQANVLLRKRYDEVRRVLPVTCARLGEGAWPSFKEYARSHWPQRVPMALYDARAFCNYLGTRNPDVLSRSELNRIRFAGSNRLFSLSFVPDMPRGQRTHFGIQLLLRSGRHGWRELAICFCP
jgi:hypothetical protein